MRSVHVIPAVLAAAIMLAGMLVAADPVEKELGKEIGKALISKNDVKLLELIPRLNEEGVSARFRLDYCQKLLLTPAGKDLSSEAVAAVITVLNDAYTAAQDVREQKPILGLIGSAMDKVNREKERFVMLLAFYRKVPDPAVLKSVKKLIGRFQDDTAVLCAVFDTLENIRERDSITLINDYLYKAWKKSQDDLTDAKAFGFLGRINGSAIRALQSLTGEIVTDPGDFNKWWMNNRGKFVVPPKPEPKKEEAAAEGNPEGEAAAEGADEAAGDDQGGVVEEETEGVGDEGAADDEGNAGDDADPAGADQENTDETP